MRRRRPALAALAVIGAVALAGCGGQDSGASASDASAYDASGSGSSGSGSGAELSVGGAYIPQPVSDSMAAGFLTISNEGDEADQLTSVTSEAGEVTLHETVDGTMKESDRFEVPAHGKLVFESGGNHLMFEELGQQPKQGQSVAVELHFARSGPVTVELPVKAATYRPADGHSEPAGH